jgi:hypothetical protein
VDTNVVNRVDERVQNVPRVATVWKQLPVSLFVERHIKPAEKLDGISGGECPENAPDDGATSPPEIALGHYPIRHVTASAPTDEDLRTRAFRAIE